MAGQATCGEEHASIVLADSWLPVLSTRSFDLCWIFDRKNTKRPALPFDSGFNSLECAFVVGQVSYDMVEERPATATNPHKHYIMEVSKRAGASPSISSAIEGWSSSSRFWQW